MPNSKLPIIYQIKSFPRQNENNSNQVLVADTFPI